MSGIYLEQDGRPENSVSLSDIGRHTNNNNNRNIYESLINSSSRTELLPASAVTGMSEAYLNARDSGQSQQLCERSHRHSHCKRSNRHSYASRVSRSTSKDQSEELKHLYFKIKLGFLIICIINVLVVVFCVLINPRFNVFPDEDDGLGDFFEMKDGQPNSFKLCTKCQPLEAKVGSGDGLIERIRSHNYPEHCCFRRVDQLLKLVDWYSKHYVGQEAVKIKENYPVRAANTTLPPSRAVFAHIYYQNLDPPKNGNLDVTLTWLVQGINAEMQDIELRDYTKLVIKTPGSYYVYSHLKFKEKDGDGAYRHKIKIERDTATFSKEEGKTNQDGTFSLLQGIYKLDTDDTISVIASFKTLDGTGRVNYFGIYKLY